MVRVLTLGDGDFSFSADLMEICSAGTGPRLELIATGFDSAATLKARYPAAATHLARLVSRGASVRHDTDATQPPPELAAGGFDHVIFNHPHLGVEDARLHGYLLSHAFAAMAALLRPGGRIHLTLVGGQCERWEAVRRASGAGLAVVRFSPFPSADLGRFSRRRTLALPAIKCRTPTPIFLTFFPYCIFPGNNVAHNFRREI